MQFIISMKKCLTNHYSEKVSDKLVLSLRKCKTNCKKYIAGQLLYQNILDNLVRLVEGFKIFQSIRDSPIEISRKKDIFARIRQLGIPTWFISLSAADS
jgi:hypothetical protein